MTKILSRPVRCGLGDGGDAGAAYGIEGDSGEDWAMSDPAPHGWSKVEFDSFTTLQRGKDLTKAQFREGTVPVAGSNGVIGYHDTAIAKAPGITVGRSGSAGKVTVYEEDFWPHNTSLYVRDFHGNDPYFAGFLLGSLNLARFKTGASVPTLDRNSFKMLPILVPPLPEQKKIAHILSTVQRAIEAQKQIIQTTAELKKALMHKLFTEGLRNEPQKQTEIGPVPESWEVTTVGDVTEVKGGKRLPKGDKLVEMNTGFPYIRVTDLNEFSVDVHGLLYLTEKTQRQISRYIINRDDVYISIAGSIGVTGMIPPKLDGANLTENAARLIVRESMQLNSQFLMYWLASHHCQSEIKAQTVKNAQPKLALARIKSLNIPLPSLDEQREIARALELTRSKTENARAKRDLFQDLLSTLVYELMNAKTRVHGLEVTT